MNTMLRSLLLKYSCSNSFHVAKEDIQKRPRNIMVVVIARLRIIRSMNRIRSIESVDTNRELRVR